jgi:hypothetical protein
VKAKLCLLLFVFAHLYAVAMAQEQSAAISKSGGGATYITHVMVIDMETGKEIQDRTVIIRGDRISEVRDCWRMTG